MESFRQKKEGNEKAFTDIHLQRLPRHLHLVQEH